MELILVVPVEVLELVGPRVSSSCAEDHSVETLSLYLSALSEGEVGEDQHDP